MKLARAIGLTILSALAALPSVDAAPMAFTQDLKRIATWVNAAPAKDPLRHTWQRALREMNCSPSSEPARAQELQVLRCTVDAQRATAQGSVITAMELRTFVKPARFSAEDEVWKRRLSFEFQPGKGPTAGALLGMKFNKKRLLPARHGPGTWDGCPIEVDLETARPTKRLLASILQRDGGCTDHADELSIVGLMDTPAR